MPRQDIFWFSEPVKMIRQLFLTAFVRRITCVADRKMPSVQTAASDRVVWMKTTEKREIRMYSARWRGHNCASLLHRSSS